MARWVPILHARSWIAIVLFIKSVNKLKPGPGARPRQPASCPQHIAYASQARVQRGILMCDLHDSRTGLGNASQAPRGEALEVICAVPDGLL